MIGQLEGALWQVRDKSVILGVGGVGYLVRVTDDTALELKSLGDAPTRLWTHLAVREDALDLFGFRTERELSLFELLIGVSGVGPKKALAILSLAPAATLIKALATGDSSYLTQVSGIGKKNAEKLVLELKDKMLGFGMDATDGDLKDEADILAAVQALGYSQHEARRALGEVPRDLVGVTHRIKAVLKILSQRA